MPKFLAIRHILLLFLISSVILSSLAVLYFNVKSVNAQTAEECSTKEECEVLLKKYEQDISRYENDISKTQQEKKTLQREIDLLKNKILKLETQIKQSNVVIKDIKVQIADTASSIEKTSDKISESKEKLADILRTVYEKDRLSMTEIILSENSMSDFFDDVVALEILDQKNKEILANIKNLKTNLEGQKKSLDEEKGDLEKLLKIQILQKTANQNTTKEKNSLLEITRGKESEYQKMLKLSKEKAEKIKSRIFQLIGVAKAPTFGEALTIAEYVESITGVRPAFLLAILTQESNIGKNVGQCYLKNTETGEGVVSYNGKIVQKVMSPKRDVPHFLNITKNLGRDPFTTPVSCPMSFGWGGAMGPAQFIPSTWNLYDDRITAITGKSSDPWEIKDAFLAAGLYLADYGAAKQTENGEWRAAMIYFSGSTNTKYRFYGDQVIAIAQNYEQDIKALREAGLNKQ